MLRTLGVLLVCFGVMTPMKGGKVVFAEPIVVAAAGDYVPFMVWTNFVSGAIYVVAAVGPLLHKMWGVYLVLLLAGTTALLSLAFAGYVMLGDTFETRTVVAPLVRSLGLTVIGGIGALFVRCTKPHGAL
ncbi:MAG: hypothetical protein ACI9MC_001942 [Kiritimatiellia bacterium]